MSAEWGNYYTIDSLKLPANDRNIIVSIHYYDPHFFTHQGANWMPGEYQTVGLVWPGPPAKKVTPVAAVQSVEWARTFFNNYNTVPGAGNPASPQTLEGHFNKLQQWSQANNRPINIGEFGAFSRADMASRVRWTQAVVKAAVSRGFSFHYWEFCSTFGVYDAATGRWNGLEKALLP
eukprot:TRINITY_DN7826_c0_g2_i1.p1 TRINITY_DN7826_c0_g2~~TRINITY_DN7826_c0_g2_i1.p1  ORF type:complete len:177 (-),score=40.08 TRINITY_DN7826_c0_g2_i1:24-554(-)